MSRFILAMILCSPLSTVQACWWFCPPQEVVSLKLSSMREMAEDRWVELCLDRVLGARDYLFPQMTLTGKNGDSMSVEFNLMRYFTDDDDKSCYVRNLGRFLPNDLAPEAYQAWNQALSPANVSLLAVNMRKKTWFLGNFESYQEFAVSFE